MDQHRDAIPPLQGHCVSHSGANVVANAWSWPLSARRIADLTTGPSSRTGPVIRHSATMLTLVLSPCPVHA